MDVVLRGARIVKRIGLVVHRTVIDERAVLVHDERVWRGLHFVKVADGAGAVVNPRGRGDFFSSPFRARLFWCAMTEIFRVHGIDHQPDDAFVGKLFLQILHVGESETSWYHWD